MKDEAEIWNQREEVEVEAGEEDRREEEEEEGR